MKEIIEQIKGKAPFVVYVGRFNPIHLGHQPMIESIVEAYPRNHLVFIGSCSNSISFRHLFNYMDREDFIKTVCPETRIAPLPDFDDDTTWFRALDSIIKLAGGNPHETVYLGGSKEDVEFYGLYNRNVHIVNRYSGPTEHIAASEVRDALIERRWDDVQKMLDPRIFNLVKERFALRREELRKN